MIGFRLLAALLILVLSVVHGVAQTAADDGETVRAADEAPVDQTVKTMAGAWEFSNAGRDKTCGMTFQVEAESGAGTMDVAAECETLFPTIKDAARWTLDADDVLKLFDAKGAMLIEFFEVEGGLFEGERRGEGIFFLQTQAEAAKAEQTPADVFGDWSLTSGAKGAICVLTFSDQTAAQGRYRLTVRKGCAAFVVRFAPSFWRIERGELVMTGRGGEWRFEHNEDAAWSRVPQSAGAMRLVRR